MQGILSQLGHLFVRSIPTIILIYFLLFILDRLFFKPLTRTLQAREKATRGVLSEARKLAAEAEERLRAYENSLREARLESYRQREAARQQSLAEREALLRRARAEAETAFHAAQSELASQAERLKGELGGAIGQMAEMMVRVVLKSDGDAKPVEERRG